MWGFTSQGGSNKLCIELHYGKRSPVLLEVDPQKGLKVNISASSAPILIIRFISIFQ